MPLQLLVCGPPELRGPDGTVLLRGQRRPRAMALLILLRVKERGQRVPRATLPRQLWAETGSDAAVLTRNTVHELRGLLKGALESESKHDLRIDPEAVDCDLDALTAILDAPAVDATSNSDGLDAATRDRVDRVLALYRGEPFEGWSRQTLQTAGPAKPGVVSYGTPFIDWIESQRAAIHDRVREYLVRAAEDAAKRGDWARVRQITSHLRRTMRDIGTTDARVWPLEVEAATATGDLTEAEAIYQAFLRAGVDAPSDVQARLEALRPRRNRQPVDAVDPPTLSLAAPRPAQPSTAETAADSSDLLHAAPVPTQGTSRQSLQRPPWKAHPLIAAGIAAVAVAGSVAAARLVQGAGHAPSPPSSDLNSPCTAADARVTLLRHNYQLHAVVKPGKRFSKGWWLLNEGGCTLGPGLRLHFLDGLGPPLSASRADIPLTGKAAPGQELLVEAPMRAAMAEGGQEERWVLVDAAGQPITVNRSEGALLAQVRVITHAPVCQAGEAMASLIAGSQVHDQVVAAGTTFPASWAVRNDGGCVWPAGFRLEPASPHVLSDANRGTLPGDHPLDVGSNYALYVGMRAPEAPGRYTESWHLIDAYGRPIPISGTPSLSVSITSAKGPAVDTGQDPTVPACARGETRAGWVSETVEDSTPELPGADFEKTWTVANTGRCRWDRAALHFVDADGSRLSSIADLPISTPVYPGSIYTFVLPMRAPYLAGYARETWQLRDRFGDSVLVTRSPVVWAIVHVLPH